MSHDMPRDEPPDELSYTKYELEQVRAELAAVNAEWDQLRAEVRRLAIESEYLVQRGNAAQQEVERLRGALETALRQWRGYYWDQNSEDIERQKHPEAELYLYCAAVLARRNLLGRANW